jgi:hypothetical protein
MAGLREKKGACGKPPFVVFCSENPGVTGEISLLTVLDNEDDGKDYATQSKRQKECDLRSCHSHHSA